MKTVLFLPIGWGIAHTGRLIMIARQMDKKKVRVRFGAGCDSLGLLDKERIVFEQLPEFPKKTYEIKVRNNNLFVYTRKIIEEFVESELELYRKIKPDLIVYDNRFTAKISSQIAGIKSVSITNANMTPYYDYSKVKFPVNTLLGKYIPGKLMQILDKKYGQQFLRKVGPKMIQTFLMTELIKMSPSLLKLGYNLNNDPYQLLLGDLTLIADIPEYRPVMELPENAKIVGPIFWDGGSRTGDGIKKIDGKKDLIYVSAGGTGDSKIFIKIIEYLKDSGYAVAATTGNTLRPSEVTIKYKDLCLTDYLPGDYILPKASLIIFPGGNATCYQALSYGVPQILTPLHIDQEDNANQLERLGTGITINPYTNLSRPDLIKTVKEVTGNGEFKRKAMRLKKILARYNGPKAAAEFIYGML